MNLRSKIIPTSNDKINIIDIAKRLIHTLYFHELQERSSKNELSSWDGSLNKTGNNILTILLPYCSSYQWKAMISWTMLGARLIIPEISNAILNERIKILYDIPIMRK